MATHTIVTIVGSLRKESFSLKVANALARLAPASLNCVETAGWPERGWCSPAGRRARR